MIGRMQQPAADDRRFAALEEAVLGAAPTLTREQVAELAGIDEALGERLWNALGFVSPAEGQVTFTPADVEALRIVRLLMQSGLVDPDEVVALARSNSGHLAAIAETQAAVLAEAVGGDVAVAARQLAEPAGVERLMVHIWRRQLLASLLRHLATAGSPLQQTMSVGFADLVGFTALTRTLDHAALLRLVERFDATTRDRVTMSGGRVIKTIGDEVMFVAATPQQAAEIAMALLEIGGDGEMPPVRAGIAHGEVLLRHGDVFGEVVNIASRLVSLARPGTVLVDREAAAALGEDGRWSVLRLRPRRVRGYEHLVPHALRPHTEG